MKENYIKICHELGWVVAQNGDKVVLLKRNDDGTNYVIKGKTNTLIGGVDFGITPRQIEKITEVRNGTAIGKEISNAAKAIAQLLQELSLEVARELLSGMSLQSTEPIKPRTTQQTESDKLQQPIMQQKAQLQCASNNENSAGRNSSSKQAIHASSTTEQSRTPARKITVKVQNEDNNWDSVHYEDDDTPVAKAMKKLDAEKSAGSYTRSNVVWFPEKPAPSVHLWVERSQEQAAEKQTIAQQLKEEAPWRKFLDEEETEEQQNTEYDEEVLIEQQQSKTPDTTTKEEKEPLPEIVENWTKQKDDQEASQALENTEQEDTTINSVEYSDVMEIGIIEPNGEDPEDVETTELVKPNRDEEVEDAQEQDIRKRLEEVFEQDITEEGYSIIADPDDPNAMLSVLSAKFTQAASKMDDIDDIRKSFEDLRF